MVTEKEVEAAARGISNEDAGSGEVVREMVRVNIAEGVHACLRRFCDSPGAAKAWEGIHLMPAGEWSGVVNVVTDEIMKGLKRHTAAPSADPHVKALEVALRELLHAACGNNGFAGAVRAHSQTAYPWPALDIAEERALKVLGISP